MAERGSIAAIVLAAGASERMKYPKPLLIFGKETVVDRVIRICREGGCDPVLVVLGHEEARVRGMASLEGAEIISHPGYAAGRTSSLQAGLRAMPDVAAAFLIYPVDFALIETATIASLVTAWNEGGSAKVIQPEHSGRKGHPVLCDRSLAKEFLDLPPDAPAYQITGADPARVRVVPTEDAEVLRDLDTPADYHAALEVYSARGGEAGFLAPKGAGRPAPKRPPV